jgi:hypothetical protein
MLLQTLLNSWIKGSKDPLKTEVLRRTTKYSDVRYFNNLVPVPKQDVEKTEGI